MDTDPNPLDLSEASPDTAIMARAVLKHADVMAGNLVYLKFFLKAQQEREQEFAKAQTDAANALADKQLAVNAAAAKAAKSSARASWAALGAAFLLTALTAFQVWQHYQDVRQPVQVIVKEPVTIQQPTPPQP